MAPSPSLGAAKKPLMALTAAMAAAVVALFLVMQSMFPWLHRSSATAADTSSGTRSSTATAADVTHSGPTPAAAALQHLMSTPTPALTKAGWQEIRPSGGVPGVAFGFGCDPRDGLAPVVAQDRAWVQTATSKTTDVASATGTFEASARAYPAGGGAVAFADLTHAVLDCASASLYTSPVGVGVEAVEVATSGSSSLVWRRGDVIVVATAASRGHATSLAPFASTVTTLDRTLQAVLAGVCADPQAGIAAGSRSPYVNRKQFTGNYVIEQVHRDPNTGPTAEQMTTDPVTTIPGLTIPVPDITVPALPDPLPTQGPTALPDPVPSPTAPTTPAGKTSSTVAVKRFVADPNGPGCGWAFTGQAAPHFDATAADAAWAKDADAARTKLDRSWQAWQAAKVTYYAAYAAYTRAAHRYGRYAHKVAAVDAAWAVLEQARATYATLLGQYNAGVAAREAFRQAKAEARVQYAADRVACKARPKTQPVPAPSPDSAPSPTTAPTPAPQNSPTVAPTAGPAVPSPTGTPSPTTGPCPVPRPAILDAQAPTVPPSPVPAPEAQLPTPSAAPSNVIGSHPVAGARP